MPTQTPSKIPRVIKARAPWLSDTDSESLMEQVGRFPRIWTSRALAEALRLTEAERIALGGVPTIGAIDVSPEQRKEMRRRRDRDRKREKRRAAGMRTREQYRAEVKSAEPWKDQGVSRATYYRHLKNGVRLGVSAKSLTIQPTHLVSSESTAPAVRPMEVIVLDFPAKRNGAPSHHDTMIRRKAA